MRIGHFHQSSRIKLMQENSSCFTCPNINAGNYTAHMRLWLCLACLPPLLSPSKLHAEPVAAVAVAPVAAALSAQRPSAAGPTGPNESGARLTLTLDDAPLLQVLHLLSTTGPVRFRLGALPDSVVSVSWHDEDPLASLDELARRAGWRFQRDESDYFLLPLLGDAGSGALPGAWAQWSLGAAPPRLSLTGPDDSMRVRLSGKLADPPPRDAAKPTTPKAVDRDALSWRALVPAVDASRAPGLFVQPSLDSGQKAETVWVRCLVPLAAVPHGARLLLESEKACDVLINGAPLARNWSGLRAFDLDPLLKRGTNVIAVRWNLAPPAVAPEGRPTSGRSSFVAPILRYEWIFEGGKPGAGLPGENRR